VRTAASARKPAQTQNPRSAIPHFSGAITRPTRAPPRVGLDTIRRRHDASPPGSATIRCLTEDLDVEIPDWTLIWGLMEHPWLEELAGSRQRRPPGRSASCPSPTAHLSLPGLVRTRGDVGRQRRRHRLALCRSPTGRGSDDDAFEWFRRASRRRDAACPPTMTGLRTDGCRRSQSRLHRPASRSEELFALVGSLHVLANTPHRLWSSVAPASNPHDDTEDSCWCPSSAPLLVLCHDLRASRWTFPSMLSCLLPVRCLERPAQNEITWFSPPQRLRTKSSFASAEANLARPIFEARG